MLNFLAGLRAAGEFGLSARFEIEHALGNGLRRDPDSYQGVARFAAVPTRLALAA